MEQMTYLYLVTQFSNNLFFKQIIKIVLFTLET
jgi:hypothetical protein